MTIRLSDGDAVPDDVLALADELYRFAAEELYRTIKAIRTGQLSEVKAAQAAVRDLRTTAQSVLDYRAKVDNLRKQIAGQVGAGGALDFDAARAEIGRRLACLRDAGGSE